MREAATYDLYGLSVESALPLPCPSTAVPGPADVKLVTGPASLFSRLLRAGGIQPLDTGWFRHARLPDGSHYLRWSGLFEFLIAADGRTVVCHPLGRVSPEVFRTYLLGQVLSFALLGRRIESLHATAVVLHGGTVAFLGDCGYGKSTLGAAFLRAGHPLLTDDLLVLQETPRGFAAYPGLPRIKLFPEIAEILLGRATKGTPMNHLTPKLIIPLDRQQSYRAPAPLTALYILRPPPTASRHGGIIVRSLGARAAFLELLRNTFNPVVVDPERLRRQFRLTGDLARRVPVKALSFPRRLGQLTAVRRAIESDLAA